MRIAKDPALRSVHKSRDVEPPSEVDVMTRKALPVKTEASDLSLGSAVLAQNYELISGALEKSGVNKDTIETLKSMSSVFGGQAGRYLVETLDVHHSMMVISNVKLFERMEKIQKEFLDNPAIEIDIKVEWQRAYNECVELLQKGYDRAWNGTLSAAKLMKQGKDDESRKSKPGFSPLAIG